VNEKSVFHLVVVFIAVSFVLGCAAGFFIGGGNPFRSAELERSNRELAAAVGSLGAELERERAIALRLGSKQGEERSLIADALDACGRTGGGVQGVIAKMEIFNNLIRELERRSGGDSDIPGGR